VISAEVNVLATVFERVLANLEPGARSDRST
jgi:hypothetical protein